MVLCLTRYPLAIQSMFLKIHQLWKTDASVIDMMNLILTEVFQFVYYQFLLSTLNLSLLIGHSWTRKKRLYSQSTTSTLGPGITVQGIVRAVVRKPKSPGLLWSPAVKLRTAGAPPALHPDPSLYQPSEILEVSTISIRKPNSHNCSNICSIDDQSAPSLWFNCIVTLFFCFVFMRLKLK